MAITPAQLAARYRGYAAQCLIVAQRQDTTADKLVLITMAQAWVNLAEQIDKDEPLVVVGSEIRHPERPADIC